jgi:hypothetical protein
MSPQQYNSCITRAVVGLIEKAMGGDEKDQNITMKIVMKMVKPHLPMALYTLDNSPQALKEIQEEMIKVTQENLQKEKGPGYLAWIRPDCPEENKRIECLCQSSK